MSTTERPPDPDAHINDQDEYLRAKQRRFMERESAERQAEERYPMPYYDVSNNVNTTDTAIASAVVYARQEAYAAAITERAIPAEQALRLAMEYIKAPHDPRPGCHIRINEAWEALRANPLAAKMLEE